MKRYEGLKHSGDDTDAQYLAHLLRLGILPTGYICPPAERALRDLARKRSQLVRSRTAHVLAVENGWARQTGGRLSSNVIKRLAAAELGEFGLGEDVTCSLAARVAVIQALNAEINKLEARLRQRVRLRPQFQVLITVPGIGEVLATIIMLETGAIERFATVGNFASYARCVDSKHLSNGKKKGEGNVRNGNQHLAWAFIEAANFARRYCPEAKRFHERKRAQTNAIVATKALAHSARAPATTCSRRGSASMKRCFG